MSNQPSYDDLVRKIASLERTNDTLRRNFERCNRVADIAQLGIWEWCASSGLVYTNTNFLNITGLTRSELDNFSLDFWLSRLHPNDRKKTKRKILALLQGETEQAAYEYRIRHPEKKWIWLYETSRVIARDMDGAPLCIIGIHQNMNERKQIETELNEVKTTLENILNSIIPVCVTNMHYEIMLTNKSYNDLFGKPTPGMRCFESRSGPSCHTKNCPIHQFHRGAKQFTCEITKKEDKVIEPKTFIVTARPFYDTNHDVIGLVESFQDITDRTALEKEKNQLIEKLQKALSQVKQLSGFLPICASCKKIRDDKGYWNQIETYIKNHSEAEFSHGLCPECSRKLYPQFQKNHKPE